MKYTSACTVKPYDIFKVKNAMVKSVCYVTEYTICNLVMVLGNRERLLERPEIVHVNQTGEQEALTITINICQNVAKFGWKF